MTKQNSKLTNLKSVAKRYLNFDFYTLNFEFQNFFGRKNSGYTLLETVVAFGIILAAVVGPVALVTRGIFNFPFARNKLIAANLAQEGIELVRLLRDNNVLCDTLNGPTTWKWDRQAPGIGMLSEDYYFAAVDSFINIPAVHCDGTNDVPTPLFENGATSLGQPLSFDGTYYGKAGTPTQFRRAICIDFGPDASGPCPASPAGADAGIPAGSQVDVISSIMWNEKGVSRRVELRERLYDWR